MITLAVGGVPEHFNYAWHLPEFRHRLAAQQLAVDWRDYPSGTGAMCGDLRSGELDLALLLTEGAVADIARGNPSRILGTWVTSPLTWGIHANAERAATELPPLSQGRYAISRYGSGSHLMAIINCLLRDVPLPQRFEVVGNIEGARAALAEGRADYFLWEKYTTKFLVDAGEFQRVDHCDTPWPCFVLVARRRCIDQHGEQLRKLMVSLAETLAGSPPARVGEFIAERYGLTGLDVSRWARRVGWSGRAQIERHVLFQVIDGLLASGILHSAPALGALVADFVEMD